MSERQDEYASLKYRSAQRYTTPPGQVSAGPSFSPPGSWQAPSGGYGPQAGYKFCQNCGQRMASEAMACPSCGCPAGGYAQPQQVIIQNNVQTAPGYGAAKNKWVALLLCFFLGVLGAHKFYERKYFMGVLYLFTLGLCGIGVLVDFIILLFKPNPYFV